MNNKIKKTGIICTVLIVMIIAARIVYVNCTYPYAGIRYKKQAEMLTYRDVSYCIKSSKLYSKEKWLEYIGNNNINAEAEEYKIFFSGREDIYEVVNYDYVVGYNPGDDYKVLVVEMESDNGGSELISDNMVGSFEVVKRINSSTQFFDRYYAGQLKECVYSDKPDYAIGVYIITGDVDKLYISCVDLGNNTLVELDLEHID